MLYACGETIEGIAAVAAVQLGALALWWVNASYARALTLGAGMVQMALGLRWASLRVLADIATRKPCRGERRRPISSRRVLTATEAQLRGVAARLRAGRGELRGVALLDRLITSGASPLYGERVGPLRDELARAATCWPRKSKR